MHTKAFIIGVMIAYVEARFGQEQATQAKIAAVQGGAPGAAATIAGASISDLLGAANACQKLLTADKIVAQLGGGQDAIDAAIAHVAAEKNTNPFANGNAQKVCADPALPATEALRGITPLIDPAVDVNGEVNALSAQTQANPLNAAGKSVFDLIVDAGLGNFVVAENGAGGAAAGNNAGNNGNANNGNANNGNANNGNANNGNANNGNANNGNANNGNANNGNNSGAADELECEDAAAGNNNGNAGNNNGNAGNNNGNAGNNNGNAGNNNGNAGNNNGNAGNNNGNGAAAGGADFGKCTPTIIFEGGLGNRPASEFTFQVGDPVARGGQGEALNPAIITNALCNQLINVCGANQAAITKCRDAEKQALALGVRNKTVADTFNTAIGFPGAVTNPSGGPANPPAAARKMRRGMRY